MESEKEFERTDGIFWITGSWTGGSIKAFFLFPVSAATAVKDEFNSDVPLSRV